MTKNALTPERYLELIDADTERLIAMGERGLTEKVPCCPGWDVAEVVWHTAGVYEHKVRVMADNAWPDPWPPADFDQREELAFLREAKNDLFEELSRHDVAEETTTFGTDRTIGFWIRRMAHEVAVHRYDAELAHGDTTPIDPELCIDGIDEVLRVMLAGPWWVDRVQTQHPVDALVAVESDGHTWVCDVREKEVLVSAVDGAERTAAVSGAPEQVFLWLWGRAGDEAVT
nr:maleylpyruvate isomerase family mycothiol-dependent enzyme [Nocardioidaceae bacterium]